MRPFHHHFHAWTLQRVAFDLLLSLVALSAVVLVQADSPATAISGAAPQVAMLVGGLCLINAVLGLYQRVISWSPIGAGVRALVAMALAMALTYQVFRLLPVEFGNTAAIRTSMILVAGALIVRRVVVGAWATKARAGARVLIFGAGTAAQTVGQTIANADPLATIVGYYPGPNEREMVVPQAMRLSGQSSLHDTALRLGVDEIVVALTERRAGSMPMRELLDCKLAGMRVFDLTTYFERMLGQIRIDFVNAGWLIFGDGFDQGVVRTAVKRVVDVIGSIVLIAVSAPVMVLTALAVKLESPGSLFYRQERVGLDGRSFDVVKFRSMRSDAEKDGQPQWAQRNDARVTRVGAIIRKLRIDELPQLFNVLAGTMSLVGPRPERPYFVEQLTREIPYYAVRHSIKPGVTGWAQVKYAYGATVEDSQQKLQYDLYYVKNHSLLLDLVVLVETIGVVLTGKGAH